ncbi:MAG: site-specific integrase [Phycisphaeraceae bacterium]|nr:site-specific integrase [Phycisphaeraceae bacterium]
MARKGRSKGTGSLFRKGGRGSWIASWYGADGKRHEHSTKTTDRAAAERILQKFVADAALRRDGVIDARTDRIAIEGRKALADHVAAYLAHCRHAGQNGRHVDQKEEQLDRLMESSGATRLSDLTADAVERYLASVKDSGLSARSVNYARQTAVAFYSWCVRTGRADVNPLRVIPKQDESRDRRRVRRPLTNDEMARLLSVARERGREAWYLCAALAGLRKGDLQRLTWGDVDLNKGTITIRQGKAKREDVVPIHPQLADALQRRLKTFPAMPTTRVFSDTVTDTTRLKDFLRAGLARKVPVLDEDGKPITVGEGTRAKPKTRIVAEDDEGRVIDLHALRTTLGTQLARAGVAPQIAQRIMRHSDYKTTLRHYTVLGLTDTAGAMARLPGIDASPTRERATGTLGKIAADPDPQRYPQRLGRGNARNGAATRVHDADDTERTTNENPRESAGKDGIVRLGAGKRAKGFEPSTFSLEG